MWTIGFGVAVLAALALVGAVVFGLFRNGLKSREVGPSEATASNLAEGARGERRTGEHN